MRIPTLLFLSLSAALFVSCDSSSGPRVFTSVDELAGSWIMVQNTAIQIGDSTKRLDQMTLYGIVYDTLVIAKGGTFLNSYKGTNPNLTSLDSGTVTLASDILTWEVLRGGTPDLPLSHFRLAASGNDMTWSGIDTVYADFNGDRLLDPAHPRIQWRRF